MANLECVRLAAALPRQLAAVARTPVLVDEPLLYVQRRDWIRRQQAALAKAVASYRTPNWPASLTNQPCFRDPATCRPASPVLYFCQLVLTEEETTALRLIAQ
jgi:hypothetical protein